MENLFLVSSDRRFAAPEPGPDGRGRQPRKFRGVAYSGDAITDRRAFDKVIFEAAGIKFAPPRIPVLRGHNSRVRWTAPPGRRSG
ncbi:MAG: hypothetical protein LBP95_13000 [Deltaproteobacteria bacterium]|jgi:hypothetical protein|nr:hypothetical protein [Deltaproteobacteria bacterium]